MGSRSGLLLLVALFAAVMPEARAAQPLREEFGTILMHTPKDHGAEHVLTAERCVFATAGNDPAVDYIGRVIPLHQSESDGRHRFRLYDGDMGPWDSGDRILFGPDTDFDVAFFRTLGVCGGSPTAAGDEPVRFAGPYNEEGVIPEGMRYAVVTLANNPFSAFIFEVYGP